MSSSDSSPDHTTEPPESIEPSQSISPPGPSGLPYAFLSPPQPSIQNVSATAAQSVSSTSTSHTTSITSGQGGSVANSNRQASNQIQPSQDPSMGLDDSQSAEVSSPSQPPGPSSLPLQYDMSLHDLQAFIPARRETGERGVAQERNEADGGDTTEEESELEEAVGGNAPQANDEPTAREVHRMKKLRDQGVPRLSATESGSQSSADEGMASLRAQRQEEILSRRVTTSSLSIQHTATTSLAHQVLPATSSESGFSSSEAKVPVVRHRKSSVQSSTESRSNPLEASSSSSVRMRSQNEAVREDGGEGEAGREERVSSRERSTAEGASSTVSNPATGISIGPPSWGAETDASSEYAETPTTSIWTDRTVSSSDDGVLAMETQPLSQSDPVVSSTPNEDDTPPLHRSYPWRFKITRSKKQLSEETTTSSTTTNTSTSSGGEMEKVMGRARKSMSSQWTQERSLGSIEVPLALQTPDQETHDSEAATEEQLQVPSSLQSDIDIQPLNSGSQDLFHIPTAATQSQEDLANEKPAWYAELEEEDTQPDVEPPPAAPPVETPSSPVHPPAIDAQSSLSQSPMSQSLSQSPLLQSRKRMREESPSDDEERLPKWQKLEQAQQAALRKKSSSSHSVSFKAPSSSLSSSQKSKDSSFSDSQGQTTSSSSSSSTQSKSTDTSVSFPSSDSSFYPGSLSSSSGESGGGTDGQSSSVASSSVPSSVSSDEKQDRRDDSVNFSMGSKSASVSSPQKQSPSVESVAPEQSPGKELKSISESEVMSPCAEDRTKGEDSVATIGEDNDSVATLETQSPVVIDLTCQSQSQSLIEIDSCIEQNSPVIINEPMESSKIPRTPVEDTNQPDIMIQSPSTKSDTAPPDIETETGMDVDPQPPNSFCLQLSPSQSHSLRGTSTERSTSNVSNSNPESENVEDDNTMDVEDQQKIAGELDTSDRHKDARLVRLPSQAKGPLYESLVLDSSNLSESLLSSSGKSVDRTKSVSPVDPLRDGRKAYDESTPLQTPTDTPFRLHIPSGSLIEPLSTITPPSQAAAQPQSTVPTPPLSPVKGGSAPSTDCSSGLNQADNRQTNVSMPEIPPSIATSPLALFSSTGSSSSSTASSGGSKQSNTDSPFVLQLQTTTSESSVHSEAESNASKSQATSKQSSGSLNKGDENSQKDKDCSTEPHGTDKANNDTQISHTDEQRATTPTQTTPRKSLSLKNRRTPRRDKVIAPSEPPAQKPSEFVLGMHSQDSEPSPTDIGSDSQLPDINVPRDSQFESSDSSDLPFCIPVPKENPSNTDAPDAARQSEQEDGFRSLFARFQSGSTSRTVGRNPLPRDASSQVLQGVFGRKKDPYDYDSQSQEGEVQFVHSRRQRNKACGLLDSVNLNSQPTDGNNQVLNSGGTEPIQIADSLASVSQSAPHSSRSGSQTRSRRSDSQTGRTESQRTTPDQEAPAIQGSQSILPSGASNQDLVTPSNSQQLQNALSNFRSPLPSNPLEFTSPSTMMTPTFHEDVKRQAREEGLSRYELRHVRTFKTIIEQRIVSSEIIENNRVVQGSSRVWPENCQPRVIQEVKVEMAPHQSSSSFNITTHSPQIIPTTVIQNVGPTMNIINSPTTFVESPIPLRRGNEGNTSLPSSGNQRRGNEGSRNDRGTRAITPSAGHRSNRPPVRRVHPIPSNIESESSSQAESNNSCSENRNSGQEQASKSGIGKSTRGPAAAPKDTKGKRPARKSQPVRKGTAKDTVPEVPSNTSTPAPKDNSADQDPLEVGSKVIAKWKDKHWYMATITSEGKQGRRRVEYADGDIGSASPSNILPIDCLKNRVPVSAVPILPSSQNQSVDVPTTRVNGLFEGFSGDNQDQFQLQCGSEVKVFSSACLCVNSEAIKMCTQRDKPCPKPTNSLTITRKRARQSIGESSTPATSKKKRTVQSTVHDIPKAQEALFKGYMFMLTQRQKDGSESASPKAELNRELVCQQIHSRGGNIVDTFTEQVVADGMAFVLSDNVCKTRKFLLGLAMDVPCVNYTWISDCIVQGTMVDYSDYRLPVGICQEGTVVQWSPLKRSNLFDGEIIHVIGDLKFKNHWACIAETCGAKLLLKIPTMTARSHTNMDTIRVICEHPDLLTPSILHKVDNSANTIHVLNQNWLLQSLIQGKVLPTSKFQMKK